MVHKLLAEATLQAYFQYIPERLITGQIPNVVEALHLQFPDTNNFKIVKVDTSGVPQMTTNHTPANIVGIQAVSRIECSFDFDKTPFHYGNAMEFALDELNVMGREYWGKKVFGNYKKSNWGLLQAILRIKPKQFGIISTVYELGADKQYRPVPEYANRNITQQAIVKFAVRNTPIEQRQWHSTYG